MSTVTRFDKSRQNFGFEYKINLKLLQKEETGNPSKSHEFKSP